MTIRGTTLWVTVLILGGCYSPSGGLMTSTGRAQTYYSTESLPATVTIVDTRTAEPFFTIEIPVGKQLTLDFKTGDGDDPVATPDLMRYEIFPIGTSIGRLRNSLTVPNQYSRRIDVDYRAGPETAPPPLDQARRVQAPAEAPPPGRTAARPRPPRPRQGGTRSTLYDE